MKINEPHKCTKVIYKNTHTYNIRTILSKSSLNLYEITITAIILIKLKYFSNSGFLTKNCYLRNMKNLKPITIFPKYNISNYKRFLRKSVEEFHVSYKKPWNYCHNFVPEMLITYVIKGITKQYIFTKISQFPTLIQNISCNQTKLLLQFPLMTFL